MSLLSFFTADINTKYVALPMIALKTAKKLTRKAVAESERRMKMPSDRIQWPYSTLGSVSEWSVALDGMSKRPRGTSTYLRPIAGFGTQITRRKDCERAYVERFIVPLGDSYSGT